VKGVPVGDRAATKDEHKAFHARLEEILARTRSRLGLITSGRAEVRVMTVRAHVVKSYERNAYEYVYLRKTKTKTTTKSTRPSTSP